MQLPSFSQTLRHDKPNIAGFHVSELQQGQRHAQMTFTWGTGQIVYLICSLYECC